MGFHACENALLLALDWRKAFKILLALGCPSEICNIIKRMYRDASFSIRMTDTKKDKHGVRQTRRKTDTENDRHRERQTQRKTDTEGDRHTE